MSPGALAVRDNLIAEGRSKPMILVMPFGYSVPGVGTGQFRAPSNLATPSSCGDDLPNQSSTAFAHDLVDDLIPFFQSRYRTSKSPDDRAIGGLSMGACQTAAIAFTHSDVFHSIILMSPGALTNVDRVFPTFFEDAARLNKKMKLVWIASGRDDPRTETGAKTLDTALSAHGVTHTFLVTDGRHEWVVWRHHLHDVAPLLFR